MLSDGDDASKLVHTAVLDTDDIPFRITSFAVQLWDGGNNSAPETCEMLELRPEQKEQKSLGCCIYDKLGGVRFRISHSAFFQVRGSKL